MQMNALYRFRFKNLKSLEYMRQMRRVSCYFSLHLWLSLVPFWYWSETKPFRVISLWKVCSSRGYIGWSRGHVVIKSGKSVLGRS